MTDKSEFTENLNYEWQSPPPSQVSRGRFNWQIEETDPYEDLRDAMESDEWPVAHMRAEIEAMDAKPVGRTRNALTAQLLEVFSDKQRLQKTLRSLSEEERVFYPYFLLQYLLISNHTQPAQLDKFVPDYKNSMRLPDLILARSLALQNRYDEYLFPRVMLANLPQLEVQLNTAPEPETYIPAQTPHLLAIQLQQMLAMVQQNSLELRPVLTWRSPGMYSAWRHEPQWPVYPDSARMLEEKDSYHGVLELMPPSLSMDKPSNDLLADKLNLSSHCVDFLYRSLKLAGVVYSGSPLQTLDKLVSQWITLPAGRQAAIVFETFIRMGDWAAWWHSWVSGKVEVGWDYDTYHYGPVVTNSMSLTVSILRRSILDVLAFVPHDVWINTQDFVRLLQTIFPERDSQAYQNTLVLNGKNGSWNDFLEQAALAIIAGPLHWLGFADIAPDADAPVAFRLHHFQDVYWRRTQVVPASSGTPFSNDSLNINGDELTLQLPAPSDVLAFVQNWANLKHFGGDNLLFELSIPLLHGCFEMGKTADSLMAEWEKLVGSPAPDSLREWWTGWDARYGHIRLYTHQSALVTRDTLTMTEIQTAIPAIQPGIRGMIAPNFALLDDAQVEDIISHLKRQGYMPKED